MMNETNALNLGRSIGDREVEEKDSANMASAMAVVVGGAAGEHETLGQIAE